MLPSEAVLLSSRDFYLARQARLLAKLTGNEAGIWE